MGPADTQACRDGIAVMVVSPHGPRVQALKEALAFDSHLRWLETPPGALIGWATQVLVAQPRVLLLDAALLPALAASDASAWRLRLPGLRVLLWAERADAALVERIVLQHWSGCLSVDDTPQACLKAIHAVDRGELWLPRALLAEAVAHRLAPSADAPESGSALTPREVEVVEHLRRGATNKEIARALGIMEDTVKKHLKSVFAKLGVHRRGLVMLRDPATGGGLFHLRGMGAHPPA